MSSDPLLAGIFSAPAILPALRARSKAEALLEMIDGMVDAGVLPKARRSQVQVALEEREERGTTGLGRGVAIPHAKIDGLRKHAALVARSGDGIDFRAIDGEPVHVFVLLVSPLARDDEHLQALRWVSRVVRDPDFSSFIRQARSAGEILEVLHERAVLR